MTTASPNEFTATPTAYGWLLASLCFVLAGCTGMKGATVGATDPLVGGPPPKADTSSPPPGAKASTATASLQAAAQIPPIPIPTASTSPTALASNTQPRSFGGGSDLRITTPRQAPPPVNDGWAGQNVAQASVAPVNVPTGWGNRSASDAAPVREPEPTTVISPVSLPVAPKEAPSIEQLRQRLAQRGLLYEKLELQQESGEWKFTCILPRRTDPNLRRTYTACAKDPIAAVQAVVDQVDKEP